MILKYYNAKIDIANDDWEHETYEIKCPKCEGGNLLNVDFESEVIDGYSNNTITLKCKDCSEVFLATDIDLEIVEY